MQSSNGHDPNANAILRDKVRDILEERNQLAARVLELEIALAPFAEVMLTRWSQHQEPNATMPIRMVVIQDAARAYAGTVLPKAPQAKPKAA